MHLRNILLAAASIVVVAAHPHLHNRYTANGDHTQIHQHRRASAASPVYYAPGNSVMTMDSMIPGFSTSDVMDSVSSAMGLGPGELVMTHSLKASGFTSVYVMQACDNLPIKNTVATVNVADGGNIIRAIGNLQTNNDCSSAMAQPTTVMPQQAIQNVALNHLGVHISLASIVFNSAAGGYDCPAPIVGPVRTSLALYMLPSGSAVKVWDLVVQTNKIYENIFVDVTSGEIVATAPFTSKALPFAAAAARAAAAAPAARREYIPSARDAATSEGPGLQRRQVFSSMQTPKTSFFAIPFGKTSVGTSPQTMIEDAHNQLPSPLGYITFFNGTNQNIVTMTVTGNNAIAQPNPMNLTTTDIANVPLFRPPGSMTAAGQLVFNYTFDSTANIMSFQDPTKPFVPANAGVSGNNSAAAVANAFLHVNLFHDLFWFFGFDEQAGNFQATNLQNNGGKGGDAILVNCQDGSGNNNANFAAPADGLTGVMRMFNFINPDKTLRDGCMDNSVMYHELLHGVTSRLVGGPANPNCLNNNLFEAGGVSEGLSDSGSLVLTMQATNQRTDSFAIGAYVVNSDKGVRTQKYSTDINVNTRMYSDLAGTAAMNDAHAAGEVVAALLLEVYWNMVDQMPFNVDLMGSAIKCQSSPMTCPGNAAFLRLLVEASRVMACNPTVYQMKQAFMDANTAVFNGLYDMAIRQGFAKRGLGSLAVDNQEFVNDFTV